MTIIEIPDSWMGKPIDGALERVLAKKNVVVPSQVQPASPIILPGQINPRDYITVPGYNIVIAKAETHKNRNWLETLDDLGAEGLMVPTIAQFMCHWMNVKTAVVDGMNILQYADGTAVPNTEAEDLWKYMSSGHRGGCWTWLNARFLENGGNWKMVSEYKGTSSKNVEVDLKCRIRQDKLVGLAFNDQGFPELESQETSYKAGQNIYFYHPRNNTVARFSADSDWADLGCGGDPSDRDASLGVLACAAGVAQKK